MVMSRGDVNSYVQTYGGAQLRTFDRGINVRINAYVRGTYNMSGNRGHPTTSSYTTGANFARHYNPRFVFFLPTF